ncbi:Ser/Thr protein phosphatase family protein [Talaromyces proteolyticus]|uniref:Ser/Thr protein phosphatase family protein n=1 Tax=Talaromyces proteolyticus TaxID=1131652 RepID=A0AAD4KV12_9EURO|nr:Ser/Thr protein phosphatase family protein [Talaromyces proteolyticus]KAH8700501.1 Ser/Thr protein phosphatase family protein [Talaromyces proteolyticus]
MDTAKTVKTRLCMISDTHTLTPFHSTLTSKAFRHPLPAADILLHAGDLTGIGRLPEHKITVQMLIDASAELKLVIAGNHDISLDSSYYARRGAARHGSARLENPEEIKALYTSDAARRAGIVYMEEETRTFTLDSTGAQFTVYASPYTPEFCGWAFAYERDQDRFNPSTSSAQVQARNPVPGFPGVDIMLTHGPPEGVLDEVNDYGGQKKNVGCEHLLNACARARPRLHVFGHIHEGFGAVRQNWRTLKRERIRQDQETVLEQRSCYYDLSRDAEEPLVFGEETLFVNASVVNARYKPENAPWVVDLDLPVVT